MHKTIFSKIFHFSYSWVGIITLLIVFGVFLQAYISQFKNRANVKSEVSELWEQKESFMSSNIQLEENLRFLGRESYKAAVARSLSMKVEGEEVIIFPENFRVLKNDQNSKNQEEISNPKKWWNYFFDGEA